MSGNSSSNKKIKTSGENLDESHALHISHLESIRSHILSTPNVPSNSTAMQSILRSIDDEVRKATRDYKLRKKFEREQAKIRTETGMMEEGGEAMGGGGDGGDGDCCDEGWQDVTVPTSPQAPADRIPGSAGTTPPGGASSSLRSSPELVTAKSGDDTMTGGGQDQASSTSPLGQSLADVVTRSVADSSVRVSTPLSAVALALHAALRSDILGFKCTGLPDEDDDDNDGHVDKNNQKKKGASKGSGFAAPIRELPKNKFVPDNWDDSSSCSKKISLRYRKDGLGSTILRVRALDPAPHQPDGAVSISVISSTNSEPTGHVGLGGGGGGQRSFAMGQHVNLAGLAAAITSERARLGITDPSVEVKVSPVLHYLDLAGLMTTFVRSFDLGAVRDAPEEAEAGLHVGDGGTNKMEVESEGPSAASGESVRPTLRVPPPGVVGGLPAPIPTVPIVPGMPQPNLPAAPNVPQPGQPPRIEDLDPNLRRRGPGGDFAGDLAPGGILDPSRGFSQEDNRGSLMGPNHPAFRDGERYGIGDDDYDIGGGGDGGDDPRMPHIGGTGMAPRFDPYYPPGVGPDLGRGRGRGGPGGRGRGGRGRGRLPPSGGDPNPDHLRPPNSFNDNMFM